MSDICPKCHLKRPLRGHDACLGHLPGVISACCGHGKTRGWITWKNGTSIMFDSNGLTVSRVKNWREFLRQEFGFLWR